MRHDAASRWNELDSKRRSLITRCQKYAAFTVPRVCPPDGYDETFELQHDYQSVGAQSVRHLVNKMMLTLYAPSRPSMRLDLSADAEAELSSIGLEQADLVDELAASESKAWSYIDKLGLRPKLFDGLTKLVVTGNTLQDTSEHTVQYYGIRDYVVRRSRTGKWIELLIREKVLFDELDAKAQAIYSGSIPADREVCFYRWVVFKQGKYHLSQWVEQQRLPKPFDGTFTEETVPYTPLMWDWVQGNHYGSGLVEDYQGDFAALSMLSESLVTAAILASEFRWLVDPQSVTKPRDLMESSNGAALPGRDGDIRPVNTGTVGTLAPTQAIASDYISRIGRGFLLQSAVTRDAERVTAEEIRRQAMELETSLGGAYSRIAVDMQTPLARFLMKESKFTVAGNTVTPTILTGLDALSRDKDLENIKMFLQDIAILSSLGPATQLINMSRVLKALAAGRGLRSSEFINPAQPQPAEQAPEGEPTA